VRCRGRWVGKGAAFLVVMLAVLALLSFVVMGLWNALIPELFHGPTVQFWQAAGLLVLCRILFGGFRRHGHGWHHHRHGRWREYLREHWGSLTPEERERLRAKLRNRCGWGVEDFPGEQPDSHSGEQTKP